MKKSILAIVLSASLLVSATSCTGNPDGPAAESTLPRITGQSTQTPETNPAETSVVTAPTYDIASMSLDEVVGALLTEAGTTGDELNEYNYAIEENAGIGLIDGRTVSYYMLDENPDVFGGFNVFQFDTGNTAFQALQPGDYIEVSFQFNDEIMSGSQYVTAINGPYVFSAWEIPRGGNSNSAAPFVCSEIQAAYTAFAG